MASMRDIKRRKESIQSTQQITKAMKLVSTVKFQRAKNRADANKFYFELMYDSMCDIMALSESINHPYLQDSGSGRNVIILITSNRGLAGGYNNNVSKLAAEQFSAADTDVYTIGRKGMEYMQRKGFHVLRDDSEVINAPLYRDAMVLSKYLLEKYSSGEIRSIHLAYTDFVNTVTHLPKVMQLLPVADMSSEEKQERRTNNLMNYDGEEEEMLDALIPQYMASLIYGGMLSSVASENGARMQAMDNATSNANDMISDLELAYNRARQGSITQELTEIIGGAEAISN